MRRRAFLFGLGACAALPRAARATGGLDVGGGPVSFRAVRVLIASGAAIGAPVQLDGWHFSWRGRTYRGAFSLVDLSSGRRGLVNAIPLDAYLYGVMSREISPAWARPAQMAQAIVARTYALTKIRPERPYDLVASEASEVYGGIVAESVEGRDAVDATAGTILTYDDRPAKVAFSACCGGHTASAAGVWKTPYPYLDGVRDPYCANAPDATWTLALPQARVAQTFALGDLREIALRDVDATLRPRTIALGGSARSIEVPSETFRAQLGASVLFSTLIATARVDGPEVALAGRGRGHGVGLCQWGTRTMGAQGASPQEICTYYFPGVRFGQA